MLRSTSLLIMLVITMAFQCCGNQSGMEYTSVSPTRNFTTLEILSMIKPEKREMNSSCSTTTRRRRRRRPKLDAKFPL
uniref:Putative secreted protein n=1 Tax=Ixodes ricinus TaxID=34613 RepID=A0A6B0TUR8_IXORI